MQTLRPLKIMRMVNITFIGQNSPDIKNSKKLRFDIMVAIVDFYQIHGMPVGKIVGAF